jgi:hypothetical protein
LTIQWTLNGEVPTADTVLSANCVIVAIQGDFGGDDDPDIPGDDDEYVTFETVFNGEVVDSMPIYITETEITLYDFFNDDLFKDSTIEGTY